MYKDISRILDTNGIEFFLYYGSAIGALRHNGFIPWDDDIDLLVWEKDVKRVNEVLSAGLDSEKYYYHIPHADTHPHVMLKTECFEEDLKNKKAPFIDIFVLEEYPDRKGRQHLVNFCIIGAIGTTIVLDHIKSLRIHKIFSGIPLWFERRAENLTGGGNKLCALYTTKYKHEIFQKKHFEGSFMHKFEDVEAPLPVGIDNVLTDFYGDYMTPPPENQRTGAEGYPCSVYKDYCWDMEMKKN